MQVVISRTKIWPDHIQELGPEDCKHYKTTVRRGFTPGSKVEECDQCGLEINRSMGTNNRVKSSWVYPEEEEIVTDELPTTIKDFTNDCGRRG